MDPETVSQAILKASIEFRVFGNGLMNVHIFHKLLGNSIHIVQGYLNIDTSSAVLETGSTQTGSTQSVVQQASVRHFYPDGVSDPTYFTDALMSQNLSNSAEPLFDVVQDAAGADAEAEREFFFQKLMETNSSDSYWRLTNQRCIDVYHRVLVILGRNPTTDPRYKLPSNKIPVNEVCPCGSSKKYKKCHFSKTIY
jgi:hypothetical protein